MHDSKGDGVVDAAGGGAAFLGAAIAGNADHSRRHQSCPPSLSVVVRSTADHANGEVHPEVPSGWKVEPQIGDRRVQQAGRARCRNSRCCPMARRKARYQVSALAAGRTAATYSEGYSLVARPDIGGFFYYQPALQRASVVEVKVPQGLKIGYIMGAGDDIPDRAARRSASTSRC